MEELVKQEINKPKRDPLGRLLPGNSGNLNGRPKGKTLKEFQADQFRNMTDEQKIEWLKDVGKEVRWKMGEGMPKQDIQADVEITSKVISVDE